MFVVVQDGTAIISVVLQIAELDPTARGAGLCSFSVDPSRRQVCFTFVRLIETPEWFIRQTLHPHSAGCWRLVG